MNRDDILRLAQESGLGAIDGRCGFVTYQQAATQELERFAALVAAAERERICKQIATLHDSLSPTGTAIRSRT